MDTRKPSRAMTLGQYLEQGRHDAGLSLRRLAAASGVHMSAIRRLLNDEVESPSAEHLQQLARALELNEEDVLAFIGVTPPHGLPSVAPYLRAKYQLDGDALTEAVEQLSSIIDKYNT